MKSPIDNYSGILQADVEPTNRTKKRRFNLFKDWLLNVFGTTQNAEERGVEFVKLLLKDQEEKLKISGIENESLIQEIKLKIRQTRLSEAELKQGALYTPHNIALLQAQTAEAHANAEAIRTETRLKVIGTCQPQMDSHFKDKLYLM